MSDAAAAIDSNEADAATPPAGGGDAPAATMTVAPAAADPVAAAAATDVEPEPYLIIRASSGWAALNFKEVWHFRDLLFTLAGRDLKLRYKQTALGVIWVILQPLMAAGIFSFVFGKVANLPSDGLPYFLFSYAGLMGWNVFSNTLGKTSGSMTGNAHLISKVYFPRLILPLSGVVSTLVDFTVALGMLGVLLAVYGVTPGWGLLLLPVWTLLGVLLALGIGLCAAALMVSYRDVGYILPVFTQMLMYASPVAYAVSAVPDRLKTWYFLNPVSGLLEAFRWSLLGRGSVTWWAVAYSAGFAGVAFLVGALMFKRMERRFADVI